MGVIESDDRGIVGEWQAPGREQAWSDEIGRWTATQNQKPFPWGKTLFWMTIAVFGTLVVLSLVRH